MMLTTTLLALAILPNLAAASHDAACGPADVSKSVTVDRITATIQAWDGACAGAAATASSDDLFACAGREIESHGVHVLLLPPGCAAGAVVELP